MAALVSIGGFRHRFSAGEGFLVSLRLEADARGAPLQGAVGRLLWRVAEGVDPYGAYCTSIDGRRGGYHPPVLMGNSLRHFLTKMPPPWRREARLVCV